MAMNRDWDNEVLRWKTIWMERIGNMAKTGNLPDEKEMAGLILALIMAGTVLAYRGFVGQFTSSNEDYVKVWPEITGIADSLNNVLCDEIEKARMRRN